MKRVLSVTAILGLAFLFMSAITIMESPQDPPRKKVKKHLKMVKVDEDGKKVELDTIIEGDNIFVWQGDTIGDSNKLKWISKADFKLDSLHEHLDLDMDFDFDIEKSENGKIIIMKSEKGGKTIIKEFKSKGESGENTFTFDILKDAEHGDHDIMMWHGDEGDNEMIFEAPKIRFHEKENNGNVIDLSDSGIISFKKKKLSGGREKITIIRNETEDKKEEIHEEIIIHGAEKHPMIWHGKAPKKAKSIKVIRSDDGKVEIFEDEDVWSVKEGDANVKVIKEDGKIIQIKEIKEGDEKKVEVKVEIEEEKK